jgi:hypothetical protein
MKCIAFLLASLAFLTFASIRSDEYSVFESYLAADIFPDLAPLFFPDGFVPVKREPLSTEHYEEAYEMIEIFDKYEYVEVKREPGIFEEVDVKQEPGLNQDEVEVKNEYEYSLVTVKQEGAPTIKSEAQEPAGEHSAVFLTKVEPSLIFIKNEVPQFTTAIVTTESQAAVAEPDSPNSEVLAFEALPTKPHSTSAICFPDAGNPVNKPLIDSWSNEVSSVDQLAISDPGSSDLPASDVEKPSLFTVWLRSDSSRNVLPVNTRYFSASNLLSSTSSSSECKSKRRDSETYDSDLSRSPKRRRCRSPSSAIHNCDSPSRKSFSTRRSLSPRRTVSSRSSYSPKQQASSRREISTDHRTTSRRRSRSPPNRRDKFLSNREEKFSGIVDSDLDSSKRSTDRSPSASTEAFSNSSSLTNTSTDQSTPYLTTEIIPEEQLKYEHPYKSNSRIAIYNIPFRSSPEAVYDWCSPYGEIVKVILVHERCLSSRSVAFVEFKFRTSASDAVFDLHNRLMGSTRIGVLFCEQSYSRYSRIVRVMVPHGRYMSPHFISCTFNTDYLSKEYGLTLHSYFNQRILSGFLTFGTESAALRAVAGLRKDGFIASRRCDPENQMTTKNKSK